VFSTHHVILHGEFVLILIRLGTLGVKNLVVVFGLVNFFDLQVAALRCDLYILKGVGMRQRNPDPDTFSRTDIFHGESVVKTEMALVLGESWQR
jgi:hypothetical protein